MSHINPAHRPFQLTSILILPTHFTTRSSKFSPTKTMYAPLLLPTRDTLSPHSYLASKNVYNKHTNDINMHQCVYNRLTTKTISRTRNRLELEIGNDTRRVLQDEVAPVHVMKTHGNRGTVSITLNSELYAVQRSSSRERNPVRNTQEAWWTWTFQKREISLVPDGIRTPDRPAPSCRKWA